MYSTVLIIPADLRSEANTLGEAMGWGPNNYSVPLSENGTEPATHYGLHAWSTQEFVDLMEGIGTGQVPPVAGMPQSQVIEVISALNSNPFRPDIRGHWVEVLETLGLQTLSE